MPHVGPPRLGFSPRTPLSAQAASRSPSCSGFGQLPNLHLRLTSHLHSVSCLHAHPGCLSAQRSIHSYPTVTCTAAHPKVSSPSSHPTPASFPTVCSPNTSSILFVNVTIRAIFLGPRSLGTGKNLPCQPSRTATSDPTNVTIPFQCVCFFNSKKQRQ